MWTQQGNRYQYCGSPVCWHSTLRSMAGGVDLASLACWTQLQYIAATTVYRKVLVRHCCCHQDLGPKAPFLLGKSPKLLNLSLMNLQDCLHLHDSHPQTSQHQLNIPVWGISPQIALCLHIFLFACALERSSEPTPQMLPYECHGLNSVHIRYFGFSHSYWFFLCPS